MKSTAIRREEANEREGGIEVYFVEAIAFMRKMRLGESNVWVGTENLVQGSIEDLANFMKIETRTDCPAH